MGEPQNSQWSGTFSRMPTEANLSRMPAEVDPLDVVGVSFNASMGNALSSEAWPLIEADDKTLNILPDVDDAEYFTDFSALIEDGATAAEIQSQFDEGVQWTDLSFTTQASLHSTLCNAKPRSLTTERWWNIGLSLRARPLLEVLPRPSPLPTHGGNSKVHPTNWGLTAGQMIMFIEACMQTEDWDEHWFDLSWKEPLNCVVSVDSYKDKMGDTRFGLCPERHVNMHNLNALVQQWTENTGSSVSLLFNCEPKHAEVMLSHSWSGDVEQTLEVMLNEFTDRKTVVWFCTFSMYQKKPEWICSGPTVQQQVELVPAPFVSVIRGASSMFVIHTDTGSVYSRIWCCREIFEALEQNLPVKHGSSFSLVEWRKVAYVMFPFIPLFSWLSCTAFIGLIFGDLDAFLFLYAIFFSACGVFGFLFFLAALARERAALQVDTANAESSSASDKEMIVKEVNEGCGFGRIDEAVYRDRLAGYLYKAAKQEVPVSEENPKGFKVIQVSNLLCGWIPKPLDKVFVASVICVIFGSGFWLGFYVRTGYMFWTMSTPCLVFWPWCFLRYIPDEETQNGGD